MNIKRDGGRLYDWTGPTALLVERIYGSKSPVVTFVRRAKEVCREAKIAGPPFDPRAYASALGITIEERGDMSLDGLLRRVDNNFVIQVKKAAGEHRKNFTIAHEIAHTFFYESLLRAESFRGHEGHDPEEERLCDIAAAELLMPYSTFRHDLLRLRDEKQRITPLTILRMIDLYRVSLTAIATRAAWVMRNLACALWRPQGPAINLEWMTPANLRGLRLCQTGRSSVEVAIKNNPGEIVAGIDSFYGRERRRLRKETVSYKLRSGQIFSVIILKSDRNKSQVSALQPQLPEREVTADPVHSGKGRRTARGAEQLSFRWLPTQAKWGPTKSLS